MIKYYLPIYIGLLFFNQPVLGQSKRMRDYNYLGWISTTGTINLNKKTSIHTEYQFRRNDFGLTWQQSLMRVGINMQLHSQAYLRIGYGWIETFPYGNFPIQSFGKQFTEHRVFQALNTHHVLGQFELTNRYMLEQRFIGTFNSALSITHDSWTYVNRLRYMGRLQTPLIGKTLEANEPFLGISNEIFMGFGENVGENIFDQNRLGLFLGWKFRNNMKIELGYINQVLQLGREVNNQNVYQYNSGYMINTFWNL
jgi:hypothetical protein